MQALTFSNKFSDLSQINIDTIHSYELAKQKKNFESDDFICLETGIIISREWVSDLLERAGSTNENSENSFHEI